MVLKHLNGNHFMGHRAVFLHFCTRNDNGERYPWILLKLYTKQNLVNLADIEKNLHILI